MLGLKVGRIAMARTSPVRGSMARTMPPLAPVAPPRGVHLALGQVLDGGVERQHEPGARRGRLQHGRLSRTSRPSASRSTSALPGLPRPGSRRAPARSPRAPGRPGPRSRARAPPARGWGRTAAAPAPCRSPAARRARMASAAGGGIFTFTHTNGRSLARRCCTSRGRSPRCGARRGGHRGPVGDLGRKGVHGLDRRAHGQRVAVPVEDGTPLGPERDGLRVLALGEPRELVVADDLQVAQPDDDGPEEEEETASQDERTAPVSGRRLRHGLRTRAGAAAGKTRRGRKTRPSGRVPAVTTASPWPVESRSFPGDRPREQAARCAS